MKHLYDYLFEKGCIEPVRKYSTEQLHLNPGDVLKQMQSGDANWVKFVPPAAAAVIQRDHLFGMGSAAGKP